MRTTDCTDQTVKRWSAKRKAEVVLRLFRGETIDDVSRAVGVAVHIVNEWCIATSYLNINLVEEQNSSKPLKPPSTNDCRNKLELQKQIRFECATYA